MEGGLQSGLQRGHQTGHGRDLVVKLRSGQVQIRSRSVPGQVRVRLKLKFNFLELDSEVGLVYIPAASRRISTGNTSLWMETMDITGVSFGSCGWVTTPSRRPP